MKRIFVLISLLFLLAGCKTELYSGLEQKEGNEMYAILLQGGFSVDKTLEPKEKKVTLFVEEQQVAAAIEVLKRHGFPRDNFKSLGDIFPKEGLISSPTEERARFNYALSQDLSATLNAIDGVTKARVHIVLPEEAKNQDKVAPSASVFIKHLPEISLEDQIPKIKLMVSNAIEGLNYEQVSVALFPLHEFDNRMEEPNYVNVMNLKIAPDSEGRFWWMVIVWSLITLLSIAANVFLFLQFKQKKKESTELSTQVNA
ncbi:type III secretion system inner membrane ring lipoprotein SctJ [Algicola sagamiensis]|uniref:type III secretion system inner membrane ring lipoprotein SctJ n=1 Tax=Algicola sagamiensis TaxID=163869 RepID=UPI0003750132|nr:type III secretion inner membrane ring lipoprotein SctJ [Algicola sagamiensis]